MNDKKHPLPPRLASWLLANFAPSDKLEELEGDLLEMYAHWIKTEDLKAARRRYTWTAFRLLRPFGGRRSTDLTNHTRLNADMISNSFKITRRALLKNGKYTFINWAGLTLGLAVSIFIFLFVRDELSYDRWLAGHDRVVRIMSTITTGEKEQTWATTEGFLVPKITTRYPEIEAATRILRRDEATEFTIGKTRFSEYQSIAADSTFFNVFPLPFVHGDRNTALNRPDGLAISSTTAKKFFGNTDPIGRVLTCYGNNLVVTGVFQDLPANSHFHFNVILPLKFFFWDDPDHSRNMFAFYSYLRLRSPDQIKPLTEKLARDADVIYGDQDHMQTAPGPPDTKVRFGLTPVPAIHLTSNAEKEFEKNGNLQIVYIFIAIACLIILIVVINYVNLSNAIALKRAKEVAIRKTIGAFRFRLMLGFILESYAFSATAFISSLVLVLLLLPRFNAFTDNNFDPRILFSMPTLPLLSSLWIAVGFLSGFYPALIFSSFKPVEVLKSGAANPRSGHFSLLFRRGLLVFQFMISAFLIVCTIAVRSQMRFITTMDTGFNRNNVLVVAVKEDIQSKLEALKHEVNKLREVENSTFTSAVPGKRVVFLTVRVPELAGTMNGQDSGMRDMRVMAVDADFIKTMKIQVVEGRDFFRQNVSDPTSSFLLNEAAVKEFNLKNPVGKPFEYRFREVKKGHIIGVVKDFNFASVHNKVDPLVIHILPWYSSLCIRLNTGDPAESISHIQKIWTNFSTSPFDYSFLDTTYDALYKSERTTSKLVTYLSFLALAFACIGLFGVVSFYIQQRTREVGIRKVLGAPGLSLLSELSKEYLLIVISGNVLALYPAWFIVNKWLQNFSYRVSLSMEAFVLAFAISILFAYASILHVIVKMARTNPAVVLKNE